MRMLAIPLDLGNVGFECAAAPIAEGYAEGFFSDPHTAASGIIVEHQHPTLGTVRQSARGIRFGGVPETPGPRPHC